MVLVLVLVGIRENSYNAHLQEEQNAESRRWSTNERLAAQQYNTSERLATQEYNNPHIWLKCIVLLVLILKLILVYG